MIRARLVRWLAGVLLALALLAGLAANGSSASVVYGADPTPTPLNTNGQPGGSGGGGGG